MSLPTYKDVDLALLLELIRAGRGMRPTETYSLVARHFPNLTDIDMAITRPDGRKKVFENIIHWGRNHLNVRGLLAYERKGIWQANGVARPALIEDLMGRGASQDAATAFVDDARLIPDLLGPDWAAVLELRQAESIADANTESPEPPPALSEVESTVQKPEGSEEIVRREVISRLNTMAGYEFEQFVARVLDGAGLRNAQVVGRSGDEGVDILADLYSPLITAKVAVQVKRHAGNVGPKDISYLRDRWSHRADRLLFVTTSDYPPGAREVAADEHDKPVVLINGNQLVKAMFEHNLGVRVRPVVTFEIDEEFFSG